MNPVELLRTLVRLNTSNPPGEEMDLLRLLSTLLDERGIDHALQLSDTNRGNLLAFLPAAQPQGGRPIVLLSHVDVVGADEREWTHPPFAAEMHDGFLYGRGTVDTKQLTVMELAAFFDLQNEPLRHRDVYLLATCDEESGSRLGMRYVLEHPFTLKDRTVDAAALFTGSDVISEGGGFPILVGDTTFYLCEIGQKSCGSVRFLVKDRVSKNPFMPTGDGVARAMGLVQALAAAELPCAPLPSVLRFEQALREATGGGEDWEQQLSSGMRGILSAMRRNTLTPTIVKGRGTALVEVICDVRLLPGYPREALERLLDKLAKEWDCDCTIDALSDGYESEIGPLAQTLEEATLAQLGRHDGSVRMLPFISMGSSDGHYLAPLRANVYGYSPVLSWDMTFDTAVRMVHGVDERIHEQSLSFGCKVLSTALRAACAK
ncbi:MAG: M20/M25/M40 family metallo-hydrolase [Eubacteriales bacterium]|nr:M20/M25/M40 family metallo-hydrolase [Eubacteriales bacterium]